MLGRRLFSVAVAVVAVIVASSAPASLTTQSVKITSSLDGKKVLPLRIRWLAHPRVPTGRISKVDFLIDGKLRCVERYAPYNYSSDERHGHLGYLVTTWLMPGKHRFTVRVVLATGRSASDTVAARVLPAPKPPAALAGKWHRMVTADPELVPSGIWEIVFDRIGSWDLDPAGSGS